LLLHAFDEARSARTELIFDVNYRPGLWSEAAARQFIPPLLPGVDVLFVKESEARRLLELKGEPEAMVEQLRNTHGIRTVVMSLGNKGAVASSGTVTRVDAVEADIVNRFGLGDAFIAGFLWGSASGSVVRGLECGRALAALKGTYTIENFSLTSREELHLLLDSLRQGGVGPSRTDVVR
jgi:2-dehydro-3-deoxygluconokinase